MISRSKTTLIALALLSSLTLTGCDFTASLHTSPPPPIETESDAPETSAYDVWYNTFQTAMDSNPYDQWLEAAEADGQMPYPMYAEYLAFWKSELRYTVQSAAPLFEDTDEYRVWRDSMEEWLDASSETFRLELSQLEAEWPRLEVIIPHCESLRQKTIDAKKFCYVMETQVRPDEQTSLTSLTWRWTPDRLDTAGEAIQAEEAIYGFLRTPEAQARWQDGRMMLVDLDGDGIEECLVDGGGSEIDLLHYRNGRICEYTLGFRSVTYVYADGTVSFSTGQGYGQCRYTFTDSGYEWTELWFTRFPPNDGEDIGDMYFIAEKPVSEAELLAYIDTLCDEKVEWIPLAPKTVSMG